MTLAVLLRVRSGQVAGGQFAGHAEVIDTGETHVFRDVIELIALLLAIKADHPPRAEPATSAGAATLRPHCRRRSSSSSS